MVIPTRSHRDNPLKPPEQGFMLANIRKRQQLLANMQKRQQLLKCEWLLWYFNDNESNTCQRKDNMINILVRVKESEIYNRKHKIYTHENKGVWQRQFAKLTEIEVQMQL